MHLSEMSKEWMGLCGVSLSLSGFFIKCKDSLMLFRWVIVSSLSRVCSVHALKKQLTYLLFPLLLSAPLTYHPPVSFLRQSCVAQAGFLLHNQGRPWTWIPLPEWVLTTCIYWWVSTLGLNMCETNILLPEITPQTLKSYFLIPWQIFRLYPCWSFLR